MRSSPLVNDVGDVVFVEPPGAAGLGVLRVVAASGGDVARLPLVPAWGAEATLGSDGLAYVFGSENGRSILLGLDLARVREAWRIDFRGGTPSRLNMSDDGRLYFVQQDYLYSVRTTSSGVSGYWPMVGRDPQNTSLSKQTVTAVSQPADPSGRQARLTLFPNPLNSRAMVELELPDDAYVRAALFNLAGQRIMEPWGGALEAGIHRLELRADELATGPYLLAVEAKGWNSVLRVTVLK